MMDTLTHSGSRYLGMRSAIALAVAGDISLGLRITALPKVIRLESNNKERNVTRGDGGEDGGQGEQEGEVPGADDQHGAVTLRVDVDSVKQGHRVLIAFP